MMFRHVTLAAVAAVSTLLIACAPPVIEEKEGRGSSEAHQEGAANASEGADILVIAGQSNAVGQGTGEYGDDASLAAEDAKIFQISFRGANDKTVQPARDALDFAGIDAAWPGKGFAMPLARRYAKNVLASGRRLILVPAAKGGTAMDSWDPAQPASLYQEMKTRLALALAQPGDNRLVGVIWQQGESDVMAQAGGATGFTDRYGEHLTALASALRSDFAKQGCFPFLVGEMSREWSEWPGLTTEAIVREKAVLNAAVLKTMPFIPCSSLVGSDGLHGNPGDLVHFDAPSQTTLARRYAVILGAGETSRASRSAFLSELYSGIYSQPGSPDVIASWTNRYDPAAGIGARSIAQAFVLDSPLRRAAVADTEQLPIYVRSLYRAFLPGYPADNTDTIVGWYRDGLLTIDQLDAIFLDDAGFRDRCSAAGVAF